METGEPKIVVKPYNEIFLESYKDIISNVELPDKSDLEKVYKFRTEKLSSDSEDKEVEIIVGEYLECPKIFDNFKDHKDRRKFKESLHGTDIAAYNFYDHNKLRRNRISMVLQSAEVLKHDGLLSEQELNKLEKFHKIIKNYNELSIEDKVSLVDDLSQFCRDFMDARFQKNK